jgi:hypothetical protein
MHRTAALQGPGQGDGAGEQGLTRRRKYLCSVCWGASSCVEQLCVRDQGKEVMLVSGAVRTEVSVLSLLGCGRLLRQLRLKDQGKEMMVMVYETRDRSVAHSRIIDRCMSYMQCCRLAVCFGASGRCVRCVLMLPHAAASVCCHNESFAALQTKLVVWMRTTCSLAAADS